MERNKIKRIVIWGLKKKYHTHRHIHQAFYKNAKKLGYETLWIEDEKKSQKYIEPGDLILSAYVIGRMIPEKNSFEEHIIPIRDDVYYCLHNFKNVFLERVPNDKLILLQVYNNTIENIPNIEKWGCATYFDKNTRTLYQPWGTDLLASEFKKPVFRRNKFVFWVGSIWNNKLKQGNTTQIIELKEILKKRNLKFIHLRFIPDWLNIFFIRLSRIAPAIAGKSQVDVDYLPCRMFKNISYGQLGITNIKKFKDILEDSFIDGENIEEIIDKSLSLSKNEQADLIRRQQNIIKNYTYKNSIENILRALEINKK